MPDFHALYEEAITNVGKSHGLYCKDQTFKEKIKKFDGQHICDRTGSLYTILKTIRDDVEFHNIIVREMDYIIIQIDYFQKDHTIILLEDSWLIYGECSSGYENHPLALLVFWALAFLHWRFTPDTKNEVILKPFFERYVKYKLVVRLFNFDFIKSRNFTSYDNLNFLMDLVNNLNTNVCPSKCGWKYNPEPHTLTTEDFHCEYYTYFDIEFIVLFIMKLKEVCKMNLGHFRFEYCEGISFLEVNRTEYAYFVRGLMHHYQNIIDRYHESKNKKIKWGRIKSAIEN